MEAALGTAFGILTKVLDVLKTVFGNIGAVTSSISAVLHQFSLYVFLGGFLGIMLAFVWFFFRYLDKKKLALPAFLFMMFFVMFLSGNLLLLSDAGEAAENAPVPSTVTETAELPEDEAV